MLLPNGSDNDAIAKWTVVTPRATGRNVTVANVPLPLGPGGDAPKLAHE